MVSAGIYNNIPAELREMPNWVLWKKEADASGAPTKVPYQIKGWKAKSNDPATWSSFDKVLEKFQASDHFHGIGFCVPLDGSIWGFDFDDAIDPVTHEFREWRLADGDLAPVQPRDGLTFASYMEKTPSGAGFRVIVKASAQVPTGKKKEFGARNPTTGKTPGIEMYSTGRFFTFTGDTLPGSASTVEERTEQALAFHARVFPATAPATSRAKKAHPRAATSVDIIERLALDLSDGRTGSRNDLMFGVSGVLLKFGWKRADIELLLKYLIFIFQETDPAYDIDAAIQKQAKMLDTLFDRATANTEIPSITYLSTVLKPETVTIVRALEPKSESPKASVEDTLMLIRNQPPESFDREEIKYLIEPEIPKGALVLITGKPGSGKSTLVMHWCNQMARAGSEVLYLDRDNPLFIAQDRVERFGGKTEQNLMYWGLWTKDQNGEPLEPPHPQSEFLKTAVRKMKKPVIVFDTFAGFSSGDENDNALVAATFKHFRALTSLGATLLIIHHVGKNSESNSRGASAMEGAVDAGIKVVGTSEEGKLTKIDVETFKTRIGDGKPIVYSMLDGIPKRETATFRDMLFDLVKRTPGLTKEKFEELAKKSGFRRSTTRDFIDQGIVAGKLKYDKRKLFVKSLAGTLMPETKLDLDDEDTFDPFAAAVVQ